MKEEDRYIDGLVREYLEREAERVDTDALVKRLEARRGRGRRRLPRRWKLMAAAAAALLLVAGVLAVYRPDRTEPAQPRTDALALRPVKEALFRDAAGAWDALREVGSVALEAGREPVATLASNRPSLSPVAGRAESWLNQALELGTAVWQEGGSPPDVKMEKEINNDEST